MATAAMSSIVGSISGSFISAKYCRNLASLSIVRGVVPASIFRRVARCRMPVIWNFSPSSAAFNASFGSRFRSSTRVVRTASS
jgi:hypothetical protein